MKNKKAFTLMELIIVVVLIGIITTFAIPNYSKSIRKSHERDAVIQLSSIQAASNLYKSHHDQYLAGDGLSLNTINSALGLNIYSNEMNYSYTSTAATTFQATATRDETGTSNDFTVRVNQGFLSSSNPCCSAGSCPTLPSC